MNLFHYYFLLILCDQFELLKFWCLSPTLHNEKYDNNKISWNYLHTSNYYHFRLYLTKVYLKKHRIKSYIYKTTNRRRKGTLLSSIRPDRPWSPPRNRPCSPRAGPMRRERSVWLSCRLCYNLSCYW